MGQTFLNLGFGFDSVFDLGFWKFQIVQIICELKTLKLEKLKIGIPLINNDLKFWDVKTLSWVTSPIPTPGFTLLTP